MNVHISTFIIAPMTTHVRDYPSRVDCTFEEKTGQIALDQIRSVDKRRLLKKLGKIDPTTQAKILTVLGQVFSK
jgi:mRNA interferase MazF